MEIASDELLPRHTVGHEFTDILPEAASQVEERLPGVKPLLEKRVEGMKADTQV